MATQMTAEFVELTVLVGGERREVRLFSTATIKMVYRDVETAHAVVLTIDGGMYAVVESYAYLSQILTAWQPRPVTSEVK